MQSEIQFPQNIKSVLLLNVYVPLSGATGSDNDVIDDNLR